MSLQELKAHIIEVVSRSEDEQILRAAAEVLTQELEEAPEFTARLVAMAKEGREQIARGECVTIDELDLAVKRAIQGVSKKHK